MTTNLQVGQKLWFVPSPSRDFAHSAREVTVTEIGRTWAEIDGAPGAHRVSLKTLVADGHGYLSPGQCYLSREDYEATQALQAAWRELCQATRYQYRAPAGVSVDDVRQAMRLLRLQPQDDGPERQP